eukprot:1241528-Rhodomonas_salina.2
MASSSFRDQIGLPSSSRRNAPTFILHGVSRRSLKSSITSTCPSRSRKLRRSAFLSSVSSLLLRLQGREAWSSIISACEGGKDCVGKGENGGLGDDDADDGCEGEE